MNAIHRSILSFKMQNDTIPYHTIPFTGAAWGAVCGWVWGATCGLGLGCGCGFLDAGAGSSRRHSECMCINSTSINIAFHVIDDARMLDMTSNMKIYHTIPYYTIAYYTLLY